jgi:hypothetical protein
MNSSPSNNNGSPLRSSFNKGAESRKAPAAVAAPIVAAPIVAAHPFSPNHQRHLAPASGADRKAGGGGNSGAFWIFTLCFMSILFAALSSRQLPAMRITTSVPEDSYRHLFYPSSSSSSSSNASGGAGGGSQDGAAAGQITTTTSLGADNIEAAADDANSRDDDGDVDDSVDAEGFYFDSGDEREGNFNNGLWDDGDDYHLTTTKSAAENASDVRRDGNGNGENSKKDGPWVAQLLSYPNSGTSYTHHNTRFLTNRTTATTSGDVDPESRRPLRPDTPYRAPYVVRPDLLPPTGGLVLTRTHCEGHCFTCRPASESTETFELQCRTGAWNNGTHHVDPYGMDIVKRFVHLIRDPLDNCVSRMHHGIKTLKPDNGRVDEVQALARDNPVSGLDAWCAYLDELSRPFLPATIMERADAIDLLNIPCHAEFIRYVAWHNAAYQMTMVKYAATVPTYHLYYENYTTNFDGVVRELYEDFLQYPPISAHPRPFIAGKTYHYLFSPQHQLDVARLVRTLALPPVWELLRHYFADLRTFNYTNDGKKRSIALLMSFPNSVRAHFALLARWMARVRVCSP